MSGAKSDRTETDCAEKKVSSAEGTAVDESGKKATKFSSDDGLSLPLTDHLAELRARLIKIIAFILLLGGGSLAFSRDIFRFLMDPVLRSLPEGSQSLVYTSGIEELNVLLKVGLYAGLFFSVPLILYQLWKFVAPGLLKSEKRFLLPFVTLGTVFFLLGAGFCYRAVLPSMFSFLLSPAEAASDITPRLAAAESLLDDARRFWILGEDSRSEDFSQKALSALGKSENIPDKSNGGVNAGSAAESSLPACSGEKFSLHAFSDRSERLGLLIDAAIQRGGGDSSKLRAALEARAKSRLSLETGNHSAADASLEESSRLLANSFHSGTEKSSAILSLWKANKAASAASGRLARSAWTHPMLSMKEQLSLVLVLEIAFGLIFELPLIMAALALLGILKFQWVWKAQRYAIVGCVIASALITPTGDVVNLSLMAVPMIFCFQIGVFLVFILERRRHSADSGKSS